MIGSIMEPREVVEQAFMAREDVSAEVVKLAKIEVAAERFVRPRFGDALYGRFLEGGYVPFVNDFVKPALAHYVRYILIDELSAQLTDSGLMVFEDEKVDSKSAKMVESLAEMESNQAGVTSSENSKRIEVSKSFDDLSKDDMKGTVSRSDVSGDSVKTLDKKNSVELAVQETVNESVTTKSGTETESLKGNERTEVEDLPDFAIKVVLKDVNESRSGSDKSSVLVNGSANNEKTLRLEVVSSVDKVGSLESVTDSGQTKQVMRNGKSEVLQSDVLDGTVRASKDVMNSSLKKSLDDGSLSSSRKRMVPATDLQRRTIRARALFDANVLMAKAVRYVERNVELFPEYEKPRFSSGRFVL